MKSIIYEVKDSLEKSQHQIRTSGKKTDDKSPAKLVASSPDQNVVIGMVIDEADEAQERSHIARTSFQNIKIDEHHFPDNQVV